jgi:hypothetical protein
VRNCHRAAAQAYADYKQQVASAAPDLKLADAGRCSIRKFAKHISRR